MEEINQQIPNQVPLSRKQERRERRRLEKLAQQSSNNTKSFFRRLMPWVIVVVIIAACVHGIIYLSKQSPSNGVSGTVHASLTKPESTDWVRGNPEAKTVLVEYSDLECPACAAYAPIVKRLVDELGSDLALVYRHFPLPQHLNAKTAAYAAEAAGIQGKFWEMADMIFDNQEDWARERNATPTFEGYATDLALDLSKFKSDMNSSEVKNKVDAQKVSGDTYKVSGTPSFFLNGLKISNPGSYEEFKTLLTASSTSL